MSNQFVTLLAQLLFIFELIAGNVAHFIIIIQPFSQVLYIVQLVML